jgi:hypothetical protein
MHADIKGLPAPRKPLSMVTGVLLGPLMLLVSVMPATAAGLAIFDARIIAILDENVKHS